MISVAICDDCKNDALEIKNIIDRHYKSQTNAQIFSSGKNLLASKTRFDLVFLDIDLATENGIDISNKLIANYPQITIIFVTNYKSFYPEAFSVHAYQYVIKPVENDNFKKILEEAISHVKNIYSQNTICLDINNEIVNIDLREIIFFEFTNRKVKMVKQNEVKFLRTSLKYIYENVKAFDFGMPHKAFIVNYFHIKAINGIDLLLDNSEHIPIAQKRAAVFKKEFYNFLHRVYYVL